MGKKPRKPNRKDVLTDDEKIDLCLLGGEGFWQTRLNSMLQQMGGEEMSMRCPCGSPTSRLVLAVRRKDSKGLVWCTKCSKRAPLVSVNYSVVHKNGKPRGILADTKSIEKVVAVWNKFASAAK